MSVRTTGIGSLPFLKIEEAFEYSFSHDLPFFPQLLHIHGNMIQQIKKSNFKYLEEFVTLAKEKAQKEIKIQIAGPNTSGHDIQLYKEVIKTLEAKTEGLSTLVFIDEPILERNGTLKQVIEVLKSKRFTVGVHCCNKINDQIIEIINSSQIDIFSYDSLLNPSIQNQFKDCNLALGCISTQEEMTPIYSKEKVSLISATCGLALSKRDPYQVINDLNKLRDNF